MKDEVRHAVIVGVSEYDPQEQFTALPNTTNDAMALRSVLTGYAGFTEQNVRVLTNDGNSDGKPTRTNVLVELQNMVNRASENDVVLFFFAGHGVEVSKEPFLITTDTRLVVLRDAAVDVRDLNKTLESSKARCTLRFFDACRSEHSDAGRAGPAYMGENFQSAILKPAKGWASLSACSSGEKAYEHHEASQGVFSYYLCEGLKGRAADGEGKISFESLVLYVRTSVGNWSQETGFQQTPHVQQDVSGDLILARVAVPDAFPPPLQGHPLTAASTEMEACLGATPEDIRCMTFSKPEQLDESIQILRQMLVRSEIPSTLRRYEAGLSEAFAGQTVSGKEWTKLIRDVQARKLMPEWPGNANQTIMLSLTSREITLADAKLCITVVKFNFFFWLWYTLEFQKHPQQSTFAPNPESIGGILTFSPEAIANLDKLGPCVDQILSLCGSQLVTWSDQLKHYMDERLVPLREMGPIIQ